MAEGAKNQWAIWTIVVAAIVITFFAFNYQGEQSEDLALTEIFPEEEVQDNPTTEYKFVDKNNKNPQSTNNVSSFINCCFKCYQSFSILPHRLSVQEKTDETYSPVPFCFPSKTGC